MRQNMSKKCQNARPAGEEGERSRIESHADDPSRKCGPASFVGELRFLGKRRKCIHPGIRFFIHPFACACFSNVEKVTFPRTHIDRLIKNAGCVTVYEQTPSLSKTLDETLFIYEKINISYNFTIITIITIIFFARYYITLYIHIYIIQDVR